MIYSFFFYLKKFFNLKKTTNFLNTFTLNLKDFFFSFYVIMSFEHTFGTRAQVWHGTAKKTTGGLTKIHLMMNKHGRIVSKKKHSIAKKEKRLIKAGFLTKKGHFGCIKKNSKKMKGGADTPIEKTNSLITPTPSFTPPQLTSPIKKGGKRSRTIRGGYSLSPSPFKGGKRHSRTMRGGYPLSPSPYKGGKHTRKKGGSSLTPLHDEHTESSLE